MSDALDDAIERGAKSFAAREPVVLSHLIGAPITGLVVLFAPGDPGNAAEQITAGVVALALVAQGFIVRRWVRPAWDRYRHPTPNAAKPKG